VSQITYNGGVKGYGQGQTIAIIDAYYDPNIVSDLNSFDNQFGLQAPPSFSRYVESGLRFNNPGWALETALDVEWAHAIAPAANLVLVEAQPYLNDLFSAVSFAAQLPRVSVVSMSWGSGEFSSESAYDAYLTTPVGHVGGSGIAGGVTFVASSGDSATVSYPSASPNVLSVGGTTLNVTQTGSYVSETGWSNSGGGYSLYEPGTSWQAGAVSAAGLTPGSRTTPDVAWNADPSTGVSVYSSVRYGGQAGWFTVGGTSAGAPAWAGLIAIADQGLARAGKGSLSNAQASLYQLPATDFNDITTGSNGYNAAAGYDLVTGLGSPRANLVVAGLVSLNGGGSVVASTSIAHTAVTVSASPRDISNSPSQAPSTPGSATTASGSGASTIVSIAPLNPNSIVIVVVIGKTPVVIVVQTSPVFARLASSSAPLTTQLVSSLASPTSATTPTHFGQSLGDESEAAEAGQPLAVERELPPRIDVIEPFQGPAFEPAPGPGPNQAPGRSPARLSSGSWRWGGDGSPSQNDGNNLPGWLLGSMSRAENRPAETAPAWGLSTMFGVVAVAAGGYHLALAQPPRFQGSWVSRPFDAARAGRRRFRAPGR
jgi:subtilase family serine protease